MALKKSGPSMSQDEMESEVYSGLEALWAEGVLTDHTIQVQDHAFKVHRAVMASVSRYFKDIFTGKLGHETEKDKTTLTGFSPQAVSSIINFIYTGCINFDECGAGINEILGLAVYLQIKPAIRHCTDSIVLTTELDQAFQVLGLFQKYDIGAGLNFIENYIQDNIGPVIRHCKPEKLSFEGFLCMIDHWWKTEWDLFDTANLWISNDFQEREKHLNEVLSRVRYALMTTEELQNLVTSFTYINFPGTWRQLVKKAMDYHKLPIHHKVLDKSEQNVIRSKPVPVCFNTTTADFYSLSGVESWKRHKAEKPMNMEARAAAAVVVNNFIILYENGFGDQRWFVFNPREMKWTGMAKMIIHREDFVLIHHDGFLYAMGGVQMVLHEKTRKTDSIEKYDFRTGSWSMVPVKLPCEVSEHCACTSGDCIYVAGGIDDNYNLVDRMDCYDLNTRTWSAKVLNTSFTPWQMFSVKQKGEKQILIVDQIMDLFLYCPLTDFWIELERPDPCPYDAKHEGGETMVLFSGQDLFFLNFRTENAYLDRYDCGKCLKWTSAGEMSFKENYLATFPDFDNADRNVTNNENYPQVFSGLLRLPTSVK